jgi:hypothetical protein
VTVLMSWPQVVESGMGQPYDTAPTDPHRCRSVAIQRSADAVPWTQTHHRS